MSALVSEIDRVSTQLCDFSIHEAGDVLKLANQAMDVRHELRALLQGPPTGLGLDVLRAVAAAAARLAAISGELEAELRFTGERRGVAVTRMNGIFDFTTGCVLTAIYGPPSFFSAHHGAFYGCVQLLLGPGPAALAAASPVPLYVKALCSQVGLLSGLLAAAIRGLGDASSFLQRMAPPAAVLGVIHAAVQAAEVVYPPGCNTDTFLCFAGLMGVVISTLTRPALAAHAAAFELSPAVGPGLARVLMQAISAAAVAAALPAERRPENFRWFDVQLIAQAMTTTAAPSLRVAMQRGLAAQGGSSPAAPGSGDDATSAAAAGAQDTRDSSNLGGSGSTSTPSTGSVSAAAAAVQGRGSEQSAAAGVGTPWGLWHSVLTLLVHAPNATSAEMDSGRLCGLIAQLNSLLCTIERGLSPSALSGQQCQQAAALLQRALLRLPQDLHLLAAASALRGSLGSSRNAMITIWVQLVELLTNPGAASHGSAAGLTLADVPAMCAAAVAVLHALPALAELEAQAAQAAEQAEGHEAGEVKPLTCLSRQAAEAAGTVATACRLLAAGNRQGSDAAAALEAVWKLHSTLCSTAHWLAGNSSQVVGDVAAGVAADQHIQALSECLVAGACLQGPGSEQPPRRWLAPIAAAHVEAVAVLADDGSQKAACNADVLMAGLAALPAALLTSPAAEQCLGCLMPRMIVPEDSTATIENFLNFCSGMRSPVLAAWLLDADGILPRVLGHLLRGVTQRDSEPVVNAYQLVFQVHELLGAVAAAAAALPPAAAATLPPGAAAELQQHLAATGLPSEANLRAELGIPAAVVAINCLVAALPAACQLAAAVLDWHQQPQQLAAAKLEVAQAAVARSCANLRCPNVGLEGGPAAGQGVGCLRCGGCRVAYYCSTACSHPDWRSGHRKVCAELAAARQAQLAGQPVQQA